jgi:hypothetical protein
MKSVVFKVSLNPPQVERLKAIAAERQVTVASIIRQLINEAISVEGKAQDYELRR